MRITGIAHPPIRLHERSEIPSGELIFLAKRALKVYDASHLYTSLSPGWEQALAKAALELGLPFTAVLPYPGRDADWDEKLRVQYFSILSRAQEVQRHSDSYTPTAVFETHLWQVDRSDTVMALWDYEFEGDTFVVIDHALENRKQVVNLWKEWSQLSSLRRRKTYAEPVARPKGAQIYDS